MDVSPLRLSLHAGGLLSACAFILHATIIAFSQTNHLLFLAAFGHFNFILSKFISFTMDEWVDDVRHWPKLEYVIAI